MTHSLTLPPPNVFCRLCVLVQDGYGMFSVVQLHLLARSDDLHRYGHAWQGRTCLLRGVKVVRRVTRARWGRGRPPSFFFFFLFSSSLLHLSRPRSPKC